MPQPLSARCSLFLYVPTHAYLEQYLGVSDSRRAANEDGIACGDRCPKISKVVQIHPGESSSPNLHRR
jgi:hypothetical protein